MIATRPCFHVGVRFALALALVATVVAPACRTAPRTPMPAGSSATTAVIETGAYARFMRAAIRSWTWALDNPEETAKLMVEKYGAPGLDYKAQLAEIKRDLVEP